MTRISTKLLAGLWFGGLSAIALYIGASTLGRGTPYDLLVSETPVALVIPISFVLGMLYGEELRHESAGIRTVVNVGVKIPALSAMLFGGVWGALSFAARLLSAIFYAREIGGGALSQAMGVLVLPLYAFVFTCWFTVPIGVSGAWALWTIYRRSFVVVVPLMLLSLIIYGVPQRNSAIRYQLPTNAERISVGRGVGSECFDGDAASIKRAPAHPLGPSTSWRGQVELDTTRRMVLPGNALIQFNGRITGYLGFSEPGMVRVRAYDDQYGNVYCGFYSKEISIKVTEQNIRSFVSLPSCMGGDGGIDPVHEVCFFKDGEVRGRVIYIHRGDRLPSRYPEQPVLKPSDVYVSSDVKVVGRNMFAVVSELVESSRFAEAQRIINEALHTFVSVDSRLLNLDSKKPVRRQEEDPETYLQLLQYKAAFLVVQGQIAEAKKVVDEIRAVAIAEEGSERKPRRCYACPYVKDEALLYQWLIERLAGGASIDLSSISNPGIHFAEHNPYGIAQYLMGRESPELFLKKGDKINRFWAGVQCKLSKGSNCDRLFEDFLHRQFGQWPPFEGTVAHWLLEQE